MDGMKNAESQEVLMVIEKGLVKGRNIRPIIHKQQQLKKNQKKVKVNRSNRRNMSLMNKL